ncbi:MAG: phytoene desaturase family protein [Acidobacteriota bacterium]
MNQNSHRVVIIGAGIAGLSAAVYALKCGYDVEVLEMNDQAGGLAMSWHRGPYTFETCLHWLVGSKPGADFHSHWQEICDIDKLTFIDPEVFVRIETERGDALTIYTDADCLESELLRHAPQDHAAIHDLTHSIRSLANFKLIDPSDGLSENWLKMLQDLPVLPLVNRLMKISGLEYARRFSDPLLKAFFSNGDIGKMPVLALIFSLGWMHARNAGYCIGGSQALIRLIQKKIASLGGRIRFNSPVERILVDRDTAMGVRLATGELVSADWVISAADGHSTLFDLLEGRYVTEALRKRYEERELFASYLQVSLGLALDLSSQPPALHCLLDLPISIDPATDIHSVGFRFFHFDPTFAPPGRTAVTSLIPTRNFQYWATLRRTDMAAYHDEKHRVADAVIAMLEKRVPGVRESIEAMDVSTPASVIRHTGNWKGSMEGWLPAAGDSFKPLPNTLPGLHQFMMIGQWVMPGGGLPSGPLTARAAIRKMCEHDRVRFTVEDREPALH